MVYVNGSSLLCLSFSGFPFAYIMSSVPPADEPPFPVILVGTATQIPGRTTAEAHSVLMSALRAAAAGEQVLHPQGQQGAWLHKCFIASQLNIGRTTWKSFKRQWANDIELDQEQQWVRLRS